MHPGASSLPAGTCEASRGVLNLVLHPAGVSRRDPVPAEGRMRAGPCGWLRGEELGAACSAAALPHGADKTPHKTQKPLGPLSTGHGVPPPSAVLGVLPIP